MNGTSRASANFRSILTDAPERSLTMALTYCGAFPSRSDNSRPVTFFCDIISLNLYSMPQKYYKNKTLTNKLYLFMSPFVNCENTEYCTFWQ